MTIRELEPGTNRKDLETVVPAYLEFWNHPESLEYLSLTGRPFEEKQVRVWCAAHCTDGIRYFGAFSQAEALEGLLLTKQNPVEGFGLFSLGVRHECKRKGLGRRLVRHAVDVARHDTYRSVDVHVYAENAAMLCLVLNEGFVPVRMDHRRGPSGQDLVHLRRYL